MFYHIYIQFFVHHRTFLEHTQGRVSHLRGSIQVKHRAFCRCGSTVLLCFGPVQTRSCVQESSKASSTQSPHAWTDKNTGSRTWGLECLGPDDTATNGFQAASSEVFSLYPNTNVACFKIHYSVYISKSIFSRIKHLILSNKINTRIFWGKIPHMVTLLSSHVVFLFFHGIPIFVISDFIKLEFLYTMLFTHHTPSGHSSLLQVQIFFKKYFLKTSFSLENI